MVGKNSIVTFETSYIGSMDYQMANGPFHQETHPGNKEERLRNNLNRLYLLCFY
jgi:hypothetical protein